jgi:flagellar biosynthesis chaperone FliJ
MNLNEVRAAIRQVIAEEMKKGGLPKSGGKLVHLKKELAGLKKMKESLGQYQIAEGGDQSSFVAEYAHMQKFVNELEKIKAAHSKLAEMLDTQISDVEGKVASETEKIKEMMGLIEKAKKEPKAKADKKADKKEEPKEEPKEDKKKEDKKKPAAKK